MWTVDAVAGNHRKGQWGIVERSALKSGNVARQVVELLCIRGRPFVVAFIGAVLQFACAAVSANGNSGAERDWSVAASVAVRYLVPQNAPETLWSGPPLAVVVHSPDGKSFFFVTRHGDMACDCNVFSLRVFSVDSVRRALQIKRGDPIAPVSPSATATLRSNSNEPGIGTAQWDQSGTSIVFKGADMGPSRLYRLDFKTGKVTALTSNQDDISRFYEYTPGGESIVYWTRKPAEQDQLATYPLAEVRSGMEFAPALMPGGVRTFAAHAIYQGGPTRKVLTLDPPNVPFLSPWLSPDGRFAIVIAQPRELTIPSSWSQYSGSARQDLRRFVLIDLEGGALSP